jgi:hypothetical protein
MSPPRPQCSSSSRFLSAGVKTPWGKRIRTLATPPQASWLSPTPSHLRTKHTCGRIFSKPSMRPLQNQSRVLCAMLSITSLRLTSLRIGATPFKRSGTGSKHQLPKMKGSLYRVFWLSNRSSRQMSLQLTRKEGL